MKPLLTVIVPIYNTADYLRQCLDSIQQQTYTNLQVIMVNDGSTDNSAQIAADFTKDSRFRLISQANAGVSAARNRALLEAKGDWITFVDSDDYVETNFYESLLLNRSLTAYDIILSGYTETRADGTSIRHRLPRTSYQFVTPWSRLIKRDFILRNQLLFEEGQRYEDILFAIDTWLAHPKMLLTNITGYHYRIHNGSFTAKKHSIKPLLNLIHKRIKHNRPSFQLYIIIAYTCLRLLLHLALQRR